MLPNSCRAVLPTLLVLLTLISGCTYIHSEMPPSPPVDIEMPGKNTHYSSLLRQLGPPTALSRLGDGMVWLYEDMQLGEKQIGFGFSNWPLALFKLNVGAGDGDYRALVMVFDGEGKLVSAARKEVPLHLGEGVGMQMIFSVSSLVDISDVRKGTDPDTWGSQLLETLPQGLKRQQDLASGSNGLQLMTTP